MQLLYCCCATVTHSCPTLLHFIYSVQFTSVQHFHCPGVEIQRAAESGKTHITASILYTHTTPTVYREQEARKLQPEEIQLQREQFVHPLRGVS